MKIVLVGATGTIGTAVTAELGTRHDVIRVGKTRGDQTADMTVPADIESLFQRTGKVDAIICAAGKAHFGALTDMTAALFNVGLQNKLIGQLNLVLAGLKWLNDGGSITLTSGILARDFIAKGTSGSMINGALESFVGAAAIELPRGLRINVVSPTLLEEALPRSGAFFPGFPTASGARVARAYVKSIEGAQTGQVYRIDA